MPTALRSLLPGATPRRLLGTAILVALLAALLSLAGGARLPRADMVFNNGAEITTLDPATVLGIPEGRVMVALYEGLTVRHPRTLEPLPGMAERWEVSGDGLTYTFHLRPDARWSNGDALGAEDFVWSWRRLLEPATASEYAYQLWYVRGARAYTLLPHDRRYAGPAAPGSWVREAGEGRVRIGLDAALLERELARSGRESVLTLPLAPGAHAAAGAPLAVAGGRVLAELPLSGRVTAVAPEPPASIAALAQAPYERFLVELEPDPGALRRALAEGALLEPAEARERVFWPGVGIRAPDPRTLVVELAAPTPFFLHLTSFYCTFPTHRGTLEAFRERAPDTWQAEWVRPGNIVTNGPYTLVERRVNDRIRLRKNPLYWDADGVAFETIDVLAVEHYGTMLNLYLTGAIDWIDRCAPNLVPRLLQREDFDPAPYLGSYFLRVNVRRPPLDDPRVRRALALSIDRRAICEKITKKGERPLYSLCPPGMPGYEPATMAHAPRGEGPAADAAAFEADCAEARSLLAAAGFGPLGEPFPTIEIHYNTSEAHRDVAEVVADGWRRLLGIDAKLLNQEWKVYLETQNTLDFDVSRSSWIGDYPDPNTFVDVFVSGGENNRTGWGDPRYDELVARAGRERDPRARMALLAEAEAILMEALPILPVYSYVSQNLVNPRLGGFHPNVQDDHFPKFWYWKSDEELARERALRGDGQELVPAPGPSEGLYPPRERARRREAAAAPETGR